MFDLSATSGMMYCRRTQRNTHPLSTNSVSNGFAVALFWLFTYVASKHRHVCVYAHHEPLVDWIINIYVVDTHVRRNGYSCGQGFPGRKSPFQTRLLRRGFETGFPSRFLTSDCFVTFRNTTGGKFLQESFYLNL